MTDIELTNEDVAKLIGDYTQDTKVRVEWPDGRFAGTASPPQHDYLNSRDDAQRVVEWVVKQPSGMFSFQERFMDALDIGDCAEDGFWCGLFATPRQICEAAVKAKEESEK